MMELYLLEQLIAFSRQGTLSGAAEKLHISQPALSQSMKKLEESLGVSLFERSKNKIALNENGIMAVQLGEKLLEQSREMEERLRLFDRSRRTLSVGGLRPGASLGLVAAALQALSSNERFHGDEKLR